MSWAGEVISVNHYARCVHVWDAAARRELRLYCDNVENPRLEWMVGQTLWAACTGSDLMVGDIAVGKVTGHARFALRTKKQLVNIPEGSTA